MEGYLYEEVGPVQFEGKGKEKMEEEIKRTLGARKVIERNRIEWWMSHGCIKIRIIAYEYSGSSSLICILTSILFSTRISFLNSAYSPPTHSAKAAKSSPSPT